ncbi:MAG: phosphoribosyltransferase family protein [Caldilineaceae bacterium]|nr:phosphoribosyltransferase family protein [Caldilineaceae bacterium]
MTSGTLKRFRNRQQAGALLGAHLAQFESIDPLVLGLLRGGVPVAFEAAQALGADLDLFLVRKLGVPGQSELAFGAIADGGVQVFNERVISQAGLGQGLIDQIARQQEHELARRARFYRGERAPATIAGRTVFLIDDGMATGASMRAAILALSYQRPHAIVPAVPVAPQQAVADLNSSCPTPAGSMRASPAAPVHQAVALLTPSPFWGVGAWYDDFRQVKDAEVIRLLDASSSPG